MKLTTPQLYISTCLLLCLRTHCFSPVVLMHGIFDGPDTMVTLETQIKKAHPGTEVYKIDMFNHEYSLIFSLEYQVDKIGDKLKVIMSKSNSTHFLGYSQGGVIGRALIQTINSHNIETFISLSAPLDGEYGYPLIDPKYWPPNVTLEWLSEFFYSPPGQEFSIGAYWHDPKIEESYKKNCKFLPPLTYPTNEDYKTNFLKLKKLVMIGGPDDKVIEPWQSSHFGFWNNRSELVPMESQDFYIHDTFGLRTLYEQNKVVNVTVPNVFHTHWHEDIDVIQKHVIPYLT